MHQTNTDFLRRFPGSETHFARAERFSSRIHVDPIILILLLILTVFGLFVLYSASGQNAIVVKRQIIFYGIAYCSMFAVAQVNLRLLIRWSPWFYLLGVIMLALVYVIGVNAKGAQRWISLGFIRFQPSEILKIAVPVAVAAFFGARVLPPSFKHVLVSLLIIALPTVLILRQPDLGTSILVSMSGVIVLFLAGIRWYLILGSAVCVGASFWPIWQFVLEDYQKGRILTLFNPEADRQGAGWNTIQAKISIGSGGWDGKGWLKGTQSHLDFLPESHTDFIIAVLAEEYGLFGVLMLMLLYLALVSRGLLIAARAHTTFSRLLAGSITLTFFVYVFVNMAMVAGLLPVVGVPLPLISLGGTSLVTVMLGFGMLMAIATEKKKVSH